MLLAPPTAHQDRLTRPPTTVSPLSDAHSPPTNARARPVPSSRPQHMSNDSSHAHYPPATSSSTPSSTPTSHCGRSPQSQSTATVPPERPSAPPSGGSSSSSAIPPSGAIVPAGGGQTPPLHHPLLGYVPHGNKILSRNLNGTLALTSQPNNESELQLYRVLQRANLLTYYDTFISQGGDDVQQLCEAGEEEFLEIMALVGMASKPLHVRRLQKALQEWVSNPPLFQIPLLPNLPPSAVAGFPSYGPRSGMGGSAPLPPSRPSPPIITNHSSSPVHNKEQNNSMGGGSVCRDPSRENSGGSLGAGGLALGMSGCPPSGGSRGGSPGVPNPPGHMNSPSNPSMMPQNCQMGPENNQEVLLQFMKLIMSMSEDDPRRMEEIRKYAAIYGRFDCKRKPEKPLTLHEVSVNEAAAQICKYMPALLTRRDELFPLARQVVRDSGYQYSKGHSRSQTVVPKDDEPRNKRNRSDSGASSLDLDWKKRQERLEAISDELRAMSDKAEEVRNSLTSGAGNIAELTQQMDALQARHAQLTLEQNELLRVHKRDDHDRDRDRGDDSDSKFSISGAGSPSQDDEGPHVIRESLTQHSSHNDSAISVHHYLNSSSFRATSDAAPRNVFQQDTSNGVRASGSPPLACRMCSPLHTNYGELFAFTENKVISSSQGNIIAVANPALSMSTALQNNAALNPDDDRHISALYTLSQSVGHRQNSTIKQEPSSPGTTKAE